MSGAEPSSRSDDVASEMMATRIVALLLVVAALSVFVLWTVNPIGSGSESTYALFLGVDLLSVAMISYVERSIAGSGRIGKLPMIAGCCFILFLVSAAFYLIS